MTARALIATLLGLLAAGGMYAAVAGSAGVPAPKITSAPVNPTNQTSATFAFTDSQSSVTFLCSLDGVPFAACTNPTTISGPLAAGNHTFKVEAKSSVGQISSATSYAWKIDTTPPPVPTIKTKPASTTNQTSATFTFSDSEGGVSFLCRLDDGSFSVCTSPTTYTGPLSPDSHTFIVEAKDAAGNIGPSTSLTWTIDTTPPPAPAITASPASPTNQKQGTFTFSDSEAGVTFRCKVDTQNYSPCTSPLTTGDQTDGLHTFSVQSVDAAGNIGGPSSVSWAVDTAPPATPTITSGPADPTDQTSATFTFSDNESGISFLCKLDGGSFTTCSSPISYAGPLAGGSHGFSVEARDAAGNIGASASFTWTIGTSPPSPPANTSPPTISGSAESGQTLTAAAGSWSGTQPISYAYQWRRCDQAGATCANISTATGVNYTLTAADVGSTIRVSVSASNAAGSASTSSAATAVVVSASCSPRSSSYSAAVLGTVSLVGYWRLGEASGTVACDSKGANNGAYQSGTTLGQSGALAGDPDTAVRLNGSTGWVQVPYASSLNVADRFTVEAWVKRGSIGGTENQVVAAKQSGGWVLMFNPDSQLVLRRSGVADVVASTATVTDTSNWHFVAVTKDGATVKLYLDGTDVTGAVNNQTMTDNTLPLAIGQSSTSAYFNGAIDDVALYNSALDSSQLASHYAIGTAAQGPANTSTPTISGSAQSGQTLTAAAGSWSGTQPISYAYQWRRCDQTGSACSNIPTATGSTYTLTATDVGATVTVTVTASNAAGSTSANSNRTAAVVASPSPAGDPVIAAAGDIACDPTASSFNGGAGTPTACQEQSTSNLLVGQGLAGVLALGDNQYMCGGFNAFLQAYDPTWGRVKSITHPVPGNHEYQTSGGTGCDATGGGGGYFAYFGAAAGVAGKGYYSYDVGSWHLIALNSQCVAIGGCASGSPEEQWLKADLAAHPYVCTLAYWHHPRFTSGQVPNDVEVAAFWQDLYAANVEIVLNGHAHGYERFAPQDPGENYDPERGIREFVVGTGGEDLDYFTTTMPLTEARDQNTFGVLRLTLHAAGYDWQFVPIAGQTFTDSGSTSCH